MNLEDLADLGAFLEERIEFKPETMEVLGCAGDFALTKQWCAENRHPIDRTLKWMERRGGFCDCSVLAQVIIGGFHRTGPRVGFWPKRRKPVSCDIEMG